jgi:Uma2 family endonuclease
MSLHEIVLPKTKPETEWVRGRALQKVSAGYRHGRSQALWATALGTWAEAGDHGRVALEWRFRVTPPGGPTRPLVPDVAYVSFADLPADAPYEEDVAVPRMAPTVAIEILAPEDERADVEDKIATYLAAGARAIIVVDPEAKTVIIHDAEGSNPWPGPDLRHPALPGFSLDLPTIFERARR